MRVVRNLVAQYATTLGAKALLLKNSQQKCHPNTSLSYPSSPYRQRNQLQKEENYMVQLGNRANGPGVLQMIREYVHQTLPKGSMMHFETNMVVCRQVVKCSAVASVSAGQWKSWQRQHTRNGNRAGETEIAGAHLLHNTACLRGCICHKKKGQHLCLWAGGTAQLSCCQTTFAGR